MQIKTVGVVGAGQMGNGIAQVAAMSGLMVIMSDINEEFVQRGLKTITKILTKNVDKGKMSPEDRDAVLGRIKTTVNLQDMAAADVVIEAATENEALKFQIFRELDAICAAPDDPGQQYLLHSHRPHCRANQETRQGHRHALHEPGAGHATGGADPGPDHYG